MTAQAILTAIAFLVGFLAGIALAVFYGRAVLAAMKRELAMELASTHRLNTALREERRLLHQAIRART